LIGLDKSVLQIKTKIVSCHTADSKPVKQEVNSTVILPPLVFPAYGRTKSSQNTACEHAHSGYWSLYDATTLRTTTINDTLSNQLSLIMLNVNKAVCHNQDRYTECDV
jgi:hypothetical protein